MASNGLPGNVITHIDQVTPAWLTTVLANSGALTRGAVTSFDVQTGHGHWSANAMLTLRYESRASMDDVARTMGQSFEAVTKTLYRIRRALLECVERKLSQI